MAIPAEIRAQIAALEGPLGAALYGVLPFEGTLRDLTRAAVALGRDYDGAVAGNKELKSGASDLRSGVVPADWEERFWEDAVMTLRRTQGALDRGLTALAQLQAAADRLGEADAVAALAALSAMNETMRALVKAVTPEPEEPVEPEEVQVQGTQASPMATPGQAAGDKDAGAV